MNMLCAILWINTVFLFCIAVFNYWRYNKLAKTIYPTAYHTVDIAITREHEGELQILLVKKHKELNEPFWRFSGGFVDPLDINAEFAAFRETKEETGMVVNNPQYISSRKIEDPRYENSIHKIITSFYHTTHLHGEAGKGYDDVAITQWFNLKDVKPAMIRELHRGLLFDFNTYYALKQLENGNKGIRENAESAQN